MIVLLFFICNLIKYASLSW